ncbi:alpha/beta fold hydrolase [Frankia sp. QA3]|uniref:alpha/beta fold hydrolase n=1 Tax=Frankia sp. QA3 TaxID=710111 RepID=UPI000269C525|nr:alpha/beta hydrolase [Frankia sp. QA3]EIV94385.1 putative hydrolase or acyltransferase of alpha/beta superfamily [Frankia sp. QA3]
MSEIHHRTVHVDGTGVFVREAGDPARPTLVLLHGFPSSSRQYVRLIDRLAGGWHVVAPDYPGFGLSDPLPTSPTFDRLAEVTGGVIDALGVDRYGLYLFDFGAPVGFRVSLAHDRRVRAVVVQNANAYREGFGPGAAALAAWWADRQGAQAAADDLVSLAGTRAQWLAGARDPAHVDPSQYLADQAILDLPGRARYMQDLLWDYRHNLDRYGEFQSWLRRRAPGLLAVWGANDPIFPAAAARAYRADVPDAEIVLLDTGHFALEEEVDAVATAVDAFLVRHLTSTGDIPVGGTSTGDIPVGGALGGTATAAGGWPRGPVRPAR